MRDFRKVFVLLLVLLLTLAACVDQPAEEPTEAPAPAEPTEEPAEEPAEEPVEEPTEEPADEPSAMDRMKTEVRLMQTAAVLDCLQWQLRFYQDMSSADRAELTGAVGRDESPARRVLFVQPLR